MNEVQVFCDESGGSDRANGVFLVAAVAIVPMEAERLVRRFRSATGIAGEVKGTRLTPKQRALFFDLLTKRTKAASAVVVCVRADRKGGWAMGAMRGVDLYGHLLREACVALPRFGTAKHLTVTPDGGAHKRAELAQVGRELTEVVADHLAGVKVNVGFGRSNELPGLQVADVVANTVFQTFGEASKAAVAAGVLAPLVQDGSLVIRPVGLASVCPAWLAEPQGRESRPEGGLSCVGNPPLTPSQ